MIAVVLTIDGIMDNLDFIIVVAVHINVIIPKHVIISFIKGEDLYVPEEECC